MREPDLGHARATGFRRGLSTQTWSSASLLLVFAALVSKCLGLLREVLVASLFGAGLHVDAFIVAASVATSVSGIGSSVAAALIPVFRRTVAEAGESRAARLAGSAVAATGVIAFAFSVALFVAPEGILSLVARGLPEPTRALAIDLVRWLSALVVVVSVFFVLSGVFNAMEHFKIPALLDLSSHGVVLGVLVALSPVLGIHALPLGLTLGTGMVSAVLIARLLGGRHVSFNGHLFDGRLGGVMLLSAPVFLWDVLWQTVPIVENFFVAGLAIGTLSALGYARRLSFLIVSLVAVNVSRAVFPVFSRLVVEGRRKEAQDLLAGLYRQCVLIFVPVSVLLMLLSPDAVGLVFERGAFDAHAADLTARVLVFYGAGLVPAVALPLCVRACYAFSDTVTPLVGIVVGLATLFGLGVLLAPALGASGVALASSLALVPTVAVMVTVLARRLGGLEMARLARVAGLSVTCALVALAPTKLAEMLLPGAVPVAARVALVFAVYVMAYMSLAWTVMRPEIRDLRRLMGVARGQASG